MTTKNIIYSIKKEDINGLKIRGFFEGWSNKPSCEVLRASIKNANYIVLAIDTDNNKLAGYITAITDGVLSAYIPFLEVECSYQKQKIGTTLVKKMLEQINHLYMIDLVCDKELASFYRKVGFESWHAMIKRNYSNQSGV